MKSVEVDEEMGAISNDRMLSRMGDRIGLIRDGVGDARRNFKQ
tara:strand:+ start:547 stop:675 length:129 start_codon:yes stop_codon:yes gene_type:complete